MWVSFFVCVLVCISASLPDGAFGWYVFCDCNISWPGLIAFQVQVKHQCLKILIVKINWNRKPIMDMKLKLLECSCLIELIELVEKK